MIQILIDGQISDRCIVDRSLANPEGTLLDFSTKFASNLLLNFGGIHGEMNSIWSFDNPHLRKPQFSQ